MRFGILFIGYVSLFICKGVDIFPDIIAYIIIFIALMRLSEYNINFKKAKLTLYPLMVTTATNDTLQILKYFKYENIFLNNMLYTINLVIFIIYIYFLFKGIYELADEVGRTKIAASAKRNWYIVLIYTVISIIIKLEIPEIKSLSMYYGLLYFISGLLWIILSASMIFSCYMWICREGDEDMVIKTNNKKNKVKSNRGE